MKNRGILLIAIGMVSCSKEWQCTSSIATDFNDECEEFSDNTISQTFVFEGTTTEMNEHVTAIDQTVCVTDVSGDECDYCVYTSSSCVQK